jgi:hydroxymethylbilane synthase
LPSKRALRIATRGSKLARWQAERVGGRLARAVEYVIVQTHGDADQTSDIHRMGGQGVFVKEVQQAVLDGRADLAVHSAKDLPSEPTPGLLLAAVPERADARDALVGATLEAMPTGSVVGTGSVRRRAQLANVRPDLGFGTLRGNIETRLRKLRDDGFTGVVVAFAALVRLGLEDRATEVLDPAVMLPQVGQGALAVECRIDDDATCDALAAIDDEPAHRAVLTERAFLAELGGSCNLPCGALARVEGGDIALEVMLASLDGHVVLRRRTHGADHAEVGVAAARLILDDTGGRALLVDEVVAQ